MDFTVGLSVGIIFGGIGGVVTGFYFFAKIISVSDSDTGQEITQEPEIISGNKTKKYSDKKRRRRKGITGRSKKKRRKDG